MNYLHKTTKIYEYPANPDVYPRGYKPTTIAQFDSMSDAKDALDICKLVEPEMIFYISNRATRLWRKEHVVN